jgi:hypothetical protein
MQKPYFSESSLSTRQVSASRGGAAHRIERRLRLTLSGFAVVALMFFALSAEAQVKYRGRLQLQSWDSSDRGAPPLRQTFLVHYRARNNRIQARIGNSGWFTLRVDVRKDLVLGSSRLLRAGSCASRVRLVTDVPLTNSILGCVQVEGACTGNQWGYFQYCGRMRLISGS